jgi:HK97 family phage prohead protease
MKHLRKAFQLHAFKALDEDQGIAEMYVSVFNNVDYAKERVLPGAFKKSLQQKLPKGVWAHDWSIPVAKTLEAEEILPGDSRLPTELKKLGGLYVKGQFNLETQRGREAFSDLKFGSIDEFSFGYLVVDSAYNGKDRCTDLKELEMFEWSPVLVGCNPATQLVGVKSAKGQYLGAYVEADATYSAIYSAWYDLIYGPIYEALYDWDSDADTLEERQALVSGALAEFAELCARIFTALMTPAAVAQQNAESGEPWDEMLKALWPKLDLKNSPDAPAAARFEAQLATALATVTGCIERAKGLRAIRAKQGRSLPESRREQLLGLKDALDALLTETQPTADPSEIAALKLDLIRLDLSRLPSPEAAGV